MKIFSAFFVIMAFADTAFAQLATVPRDDRIQLVEKDVMKILAVTSKEFAEFLNKESADLDEFKKRLDAASDAESCHQLALWCRERRLHDEARRALAKGIAADGNHAKARETDGWKKEGDGWQRNYDLCAAVVTYVESDRHESANKGKKGFETAKAFLRDRSNYPSMFKEIDDRIGLYRAPWENEIAIGFTDAFPAHIQAVTRPLGWNATTGAYRLVVLVNVSFVDKFCAGGETKYLRSTVIHEFVHALCTPATLSWEPLLLEGIAAYVAAYPPITIKHLPPRKDIKSMDTPAPSIGYAYARGSHFFDYFQKTYGNDVLRKAVWHVTIERQPLGKSVALATGKEWNAVRDSELQHTQSLKPQ